MMFDKEYKENVVSILLEEITIVRDSIVEAGNDLSSHQLKGYSELLSHISKQFSDLSEQISTVGEIDTET